VDKMAMMRMMISIVDCVGTDWSMHCHQNDDSTHKQHLILVMQARLFASLRSEYHSFLLMATVVDTTAELGKSRVCLPQ